MKVLYFHQYFSTPAGSSGIRSFELAKTLVQHGHAVTMVCLKAERSETGLTGPVVNGRRRGFVEGIEVLEFDLPYSNHVGLLSVLLFFFSTVGIVC